MIEPPGKHDVRAGCAIIYFESDRLDGWLEELATSGIEFEQIPTDMRCLCREAVLYDPSRNRIKLFHAGENRTNPPWRVDLKLKWPGAHMNGRNEMFLTKLASDRNHTGGLAPSPALGLMALPACGRFDSHKTFIGGATVVRFLAPFSRRTRT